MLITTYVNQRDAITELEDKMNNEEQERKITLHHMIDEKFGEIFFLAKDEYDIVNNTPEEQKLWDMLERFKELLKRKCKHHFQNEED